MEVGDRAKTYGAFDLFGIAGIDRADLHLEQWCHGLDDGKIVGSRALTGLPKDRHSHHIWRDPLEQFQPFRAEAIFKRHETRGIAAWSRKAVHQASANRIGGTYEHDWHSTGHLQQRRHARGAMGQDDLRLERD